jgi:phosphotransferase system HPr-like phosphotransfer protein
MGALVCRVELNKESGLTFTVENEDGKITQTAVLDGDTITITCKGDQETSTIIQKPESIEIKCKDFTLDATNITCTSKEKSTYESEGTMDIKSTKDMILKSSGKLTGQATSDTDISGSKVSISAQGKAELKGADTSVIATTGKAEVKGMDLKLSGTTKAEMDGLKVAISSNTMLDLKATGIVNLEGQMANVKGTLTKVG